MTHRYIK